MARLTTVRDRLQARPDRLTAVNPDSWRTGKQTAAQRGYGYKWQKARLIHLAHQPVCAYCEREGRVTGATVVDHATPHRGDMEVFWDRSNWVSLCASCHSSVKQREEAAARNATEARQ